MNTVSQKLNNYMQTGHEYRIEMCQIFHVMQGVVTANFEFSFLSAGEINSAMVFQLCYEDLKYFNGKPLVRSKKQPMKKKTQNPEHQITHTAVRLSVFFHASTVIPESVALMLMFLFEVSLETS
ncbi:unnamed protein product [Ambrosiozyma monospora]|uniref:Unnamed protein product n=1 Tax=Ambrosiozyma monospora TaxID=43982 RepID=A0ACB5SYS3_AMBMO|nr:unnamed protein product [Ambrosiozyma monospora]